MGTDNWVQCNDAPVKVCQYPVTGLFEGRSYIFRVRAVNSAGVSRPSRVSEAVAALDPVDLRRLQGRPCRRQAPVVSGKLGTVLCDLFSVFNAQPGVSLQNAFQGWVCRGDHLCCRTPAGAAPGVDGQAGTGTSPLALTAFPVPTAGLDFS